jgi:hypothetical protein
MSSKTVSCQSSFYPEFLTEREALALLSSENEDSVTTTTGRPSDVTKQSATTTGTGSSLPGSHHDLGQPHEPRSPPKKDSYEFSVRHHLKVDPENQKKFYDISGSMDHMKQQPEEKAANEPKSHHHTDPGHENHQQHHENHQHDHHHHEKKEKDHKHHDHQHHQSEKDHKHGHGEHHKHHKEEKTHHEDQHQHHDQNHNKEQHQSHEDDGKKQGKDIYYRRPQYDEVIEPHQILLEPHHYPQPHVDPEAHNLYYKNTGYDYGAGEVSYRSDFYWLIPLVIIIGIGALLLPMLSLFMTIMVSQGAISLTGRRKRSFISEQSGISAESIMELISKVESAIKKFNSQN